ADPGHRDGDHPGRMRHRRPRGRPGLLPRGQGPPPRGDAGARHRVHVPAGADRPQRHQRHRRRRGTRALQRPAGRRVGRQGPGPGPAGTDDRHLQPRPARLPGPLHRPVDRPRDRRPPGRAVLRVLPPGAGGRPAAVVVPGGVPRRPGVRAVGPGRGLPGGGRRRPPLPGDPHRGLRRRGRRGHVGVPLGSLARRAGPPAGVAGGVRAALGAPAPLPAQERRGDQLERGDGPGHI
ncbi:MAG: TsaB protein, required for threonylcarbamoyladenosine (t(6)A) formation in tRNA, partial [uncultured Acidimicrobiales bacterium]